jgi:SNF2 family DNA or RNA helicase
VTLKLHDYQEVGVQFLQNNPRAGLFLSVGLGKTVISLSALTPDRLPALIVAPKRVADLVWEDERDKWRPDLSFVKAIGSPQERQERLHSGADLVVMSRDTLKDIRVRPPKFKTLIFDESSGLKSRKTRFQLTKQFVNRRHVENVWLLTGTPIPNGYMDIWPQIYLLDDGERLGPNITTYRNRYFYPGLVLPVTHVVARWDLKPEAEERIKEKVQDIVLGMSGETRLDLPPVTVNDVKVKLPAGVMKDYEQFRRDKLIDFEFLGGEIHTAANAAVLSGKLSQMSAGGLYVDDADLRESEYRWIHDAKLDALEEILEENNGSPMLVFYRFKFERKEILKRFHKHARETKEKGFMKDWNAGKIPLLLSHPASDAMGLNLQYGGSTIVWTSLTWSSEQWEQGNGRIARQGQEKPVVIHRLLGIDTLDFHQVGVVERKVSVQQALRDHLESPI